MRFSTHHIFTRLKCSQISITSIKYTKYNIVIGSFSVATNVPSIHQWHPNMFWVVLD